MFSKNTWCRFCQGHESGARTGVDRAVGSWTYSMPTKWMLPSPASWIPTGHPAFIVFVVSRERRYVSLVGSCEWFNCFTGVQFPAGLGKILCQSFRNQEHFYVSVLSGFSWQILVQNSFSLGRKSLWRAKNFVRRGSASRCLNIKFSPPSGFNGFHCSEGRRWLTIPSKQWPGF